MKQTVFTLILIVVMLSTSATACVADVGTATTEVYVRSIESGEVVGSLAKGDKVCILDTNSKGWCKVEIGGKNYKVFGKYLDITEETCDEVEVVTKVKKSKSSECVTNKKKCKIKNSKFEGVYFW